MGIDNIWVFAQAADGAPTTGTLELLTKAARLGGTVSAFIAGDGAAVAAALLLACDHESHALCAVTYCMFALFDTYVTPLAFVCDSSRRTGTQVRI